MKRKRIEGASKNLRKCEFCGELFVQRKPGRPFCEVCYADATGIEITKNGEE